MGRPIAFMNFGRWLYKCQRCETVIDIERDICPRCWPGMLAKAFETIEGTNLLRRVPDPELVEQARKQAAQRGEIYKPVYPPERNDIERILRERHIQHMNWEPGESVEFLLEENRMNGVPIPPGFEER